MEVKPNYYSNPAFCQQSEFYQHKRALSPQRSIRQSPLGAQSNHVVFDNSSNNLCDDPNEELVDEPFEEQEFYEEVIVDNNGFIKEKKLVVVAQNVEGKQYIQPPQQERKGSRYGSAQHINTYYSPKNIQSSQRSRYEYIPMQEQDQKTVIKSTPKKAVMEERVEIVPGVVHRYAVIEAEGDTDSTSKNERYALVPVNELNNVISHQNKNRYEYIPDSPAVKVAPNTQQNRYEYIQNTPPKNSSRFVHIPSTPQKFQRDSYDYPPVHSSPRPGTNPIATQKLHELLSTPKKVKRNISYQGTPQKLLSPQSQRRMVSPQLSPIMKDPFQTPKGTSEQFRLPPSSKAQQKLNYALGSKTLAQKDKRHPNTAIVPPMTPMCSSPVQSVYGETTYSQKSESWMNLSAKSNPAGNTLIFAAFMMFLCGVVTTGLSFYMLSFIGRPFYLDFSTVAGFACAVMGILGCRSRNVYWLPNRNYLSGYLVLSLFSLLTCAGLLVLLIDGHNPGTPMTDMTSAAVCGFSVLTLLLALTGVMSSYCCKYPPPDNRVTHCSPGLTV